MNWKTFHNSLNYWHAIHDSDIDTTEEYEDDGNDNQECDDCDEYIALNKNFNTHITWLSHNLLQTNFIIMFIIKGTPSHARVGFIWITNITPITHNIYLVRSVL